MQGLVGVGVMGAMAPTLFESMPIGTHTFWEESYKFQQNLGRKSKNGHQDLTMMGFGTHTLKFSTRALLWSV